MIINPVFAPANSSTGDVTPTVDFEGAVHQAIDFYERTFTNDIDVTITFAEGTIGGGLAQSQSYGYDFSYAQVKTALQALTHTADQIAAGKSLPSSDPLSASDGGSYFVTVSEAAALGLASTTQPNAGFVTLGTSNPWTFNQTKVAGGSGYDAVGAMEHEISEVLGRIAGSDGTIGNSPLNLYRYTGPGTIDTSNSSTSPTAYFSINGGQTLLLEMGEAGGDMADWGPAVSGDSYGFGEAGVVGAISPTDIRVMNVLGYNYTAGYNPTDPTYDTSSQTTNGSGQTVETVKVYSYGALAGTVAVTFGASSASVTVSNLNGGASHTYTVAGDPSILFNVNGASSTVLSGTSANDIVIGDDNAKVSGGSGANLIIGLGVDAVLTGAGTSNQFAISTPNATVTVNDGTFDMAANSCLSVTGSANTVNAGTAANDVIAVNDPGVANKDHLTISNGIVVIGTANTAAAITGTGNLVGNASGTTGGAVTFLGSNNTAELSKGAVSIASGLTETVDGAANTVTGTSGDTITVGGAGGTTADQVKVSTATLDIGVNSFVSLTGDHDTVSLSSGDTLGAYGQGETITGATKTLIFISDTGAAGDTVTVSGDDTGTTAAGRAAGIGISAGAVTLTGTNDAITLGATGEVLLASTTGDTVAGLSGAETNSIDLTSVAFNGADTTKFTPKTGSPTSGGTLQILNGTTVVASISLVGNYTSATFALSSDGSGHTLVKDPTTSASTAMPGVAAMVQAMAALSQDATAIRIPKPVTHLSRLEAMIATPRA